MMLNINYESSGPCTFRQEDFWKFHFENLIVDPVTYLCYLKIASTRWKAILIASPNNFRISQYRRRLSLIASCYSVYVKFNKNTFTWKYLTVQKGTQAQNKHVLMVCVALWRHLQLPEVNMMQLFWQILRTFLRLC